MSADTARLFFALWPPAGLAEQLAGLARQLGGGRATRADTIHLTLAFLGERAVADIAALTEAAAEVRAAAFELVLDRLGYWAHNRLAWAGCAPAPGLDRLVECLRERLAAAGLAVDGENRPFFPHLTLVRRLAATPVLPALPQLDPWPCRGFVLVRSRLAAAGPTYDILGQFPLSP